MTPEEAKKIAEGNNLEYEKALENATPTERALLEKAKAEHLAEGKKAAEGQKNDAQVAKVAQDLASAAVQKIGQGAGAAEAFQFAGIKGGPFNIRGTGFGTGGTLTIGGLPVTTTRWTDTSIKGVLPLEAEHGPVVVKPSGGGKEIAGHYGPKPSAEGSKK